MITNTDINKWLKYNYNVCFHVYYYQGNRYERTKEYLEKEL